MTMTLPDNHTYQVPLTPEDSSPEPVTPEEIIIEVRPVEAGEGLSLYERNKQALVEEASRLAIDATPLFTETVQEFAARPGPEARDTLRSLVRLGRAFHDLRNERVKEVAREMSTFQQVMKHFGATQAEIEQKVLRELIEEDALIGGSIYGQAPEGETWRFYYDNLNGQDEWFFTRSLKAATEPFFVMRYIIEPTHIRKTDHRGVSEIIEPTPEVDEEMVLVFAANVALDRVRAKRNTK